MHQQLELTWEVEQFFFREARLLDERRFREWLELFTDDVRYWMPVRGNRYPKSSKAIAILDREHYDESDLAKRNEMAYLDETKQSLTGRIARLETGMAWAEDPPSRTRHMIGNVEVENSDQKTLLTVNSNFIVYRNRGEVEAEIYAGCRRDDLRRIEGALRIASRQIILDQNVLLGKNLSIFF